MKKLLLSLLVAAAFAASVDHVHAASGTIYMDTGGSASQSGTTDTNSPPAGFSGAAVDVTNAAGATIVLPINTNLTGLSTAGDQAIFWANATNANRKIFWVTSVTGCTGTGTCSVGLSSSTTCTTCTAGAWAIGGRMIFTNANYEAALRAGDTVVFNNSPATSTSTLIVVRVAGDSTTGYITFMGKAGVRPVIATSSGTNAPANMGGLVNIKFSNLEIKTGGAAAVITNVVAGDWIDNVKLNGNGVATTGVAPSGGVITNSEITGVSGDALAPSGLTYVDGNYIHDNVGTTTSSGILFSSTNPSGTITRNLITNNPGRGIFFSGATGGVNKVLVESNTVFGNTTAALLENNVVAIGLVVRNNIFSNAGSGNAAKWDTGSAELNSMHSYNVFFSSGGTALSGITANSTETVGDPLFTSTAGGDFSIQNTSPAAGTGWPGTPLGASSTGTLDMGAIQRAGGGSSGGGHIIGG